MSGPEQFETEDASLHFLARKIGEEIESRIKQNPAEPQTSMAEDRYPFARTPKQEMRCFVLETWGSSSAEIDGCILVGNLDLVYQWLQTGAVPDAAKGKKSNLRAVESKP
jgi:hypothetical protein